MLNIQQRLGSFELEAVRRNGIENIIVLRKHGERGPPSDAVSPLPPVVAPAALPPTPRPEATRGRIGLAALRVRLDVGSLKAHWSIDPDGTDGRGLVQMAGSRVRYALVATQPLRLRATVQLLPHDWRDGTRAVLAFVEAIDADGTCRRLWAGHVASAAAGGDMGGTVLNCELPTDSIELVLGIEAPAVRDSGSAARAVWRDAVIIDPTPEPDGAPAPPIRLGGAPAGRAGQPLISVLMPVHDPPLEMLREAIASVRDQSLEDWQLCLVDDGSRRPEVVQALRKYAMADTRIQLSRRDVAGGISDATNAALAIATGTYVALLDHDDLITPNALALVAARIAGDPALDMVYSDEGILQDERIVGQSIKPDWSPESLCSLMYSCHLGVYRRTLVEQVGGLRPQFDGCQDYDLVLRLAEQTDRVAHIPAELYQWRAHAASTAGGEQAKPYAYLAQPRAVAEHLSRRSIDAVVEPGALAGMHRLRHRLDPALEVAIVTATASAEELAAAATSWTGQVHRRLRIVVAAPVGVHPALMAAIGQADLDLGLMRLVDGPADDPAAGLTLAAAAALSDGAAHLVAMEQPSAGLSDDWLTSLVGYSSQPGVAVAGAVVVAADGRVADAGYALPEGIALPLSHGVDAGGVRSVAMNVSAAGGVVAVSASTLGELGELDCSWGPLMLPEMCVRAGMRGLRTVVVPDARLQLTAPDRGRNDPTGLWRLRRRWLTSRTSDPFYSPRYRPDRGDFEPRTRL